MYSATHPYYAHYDLPDLCYDHHELPSPPSATSSNMISTPPPDWHQPCLPVDPKSVSDLQPYQQSQPWQPSPLASVRPMVHPIDTDCNWIYQQQRHPGALDPSSILFSSYQQPHHASSSLSLSSPQTQSANSHFSGFISPSGAALSSSSPLSAPTTVSPSALTLYPSAPVSPPYPSASANPTGQVSLKLHQPRPSRKIPIVSLSELATACDDFQINPLPMQPKERTLSSSPAQVNLPLGPSASKSYHPMAYHSSNQYIKQTILPKSDIYGTPFPSGSTNNTGRGVSLCPCGCMTPYICH